jgi:hypothetical protein
VNDADARRRARASWETKVFRNDPEGEAQADAQFWTRLSPAERVHLAWALSQEMYALGNPGVAPLEPGLSRSLVRIVRG